MLKSHKKQIIIVSIFLIFIALAVSFSRKPPEGVNTLPIDPHLLLEQEVSKNRVQYDASTQKALETEIQKDAVQLTPEQKKQIEYNITRQ